MKGAFIRTGGEGMDLLARRVLESLGFGVGYEWNAKMWGSGLKGIEPHCPTHAGGRSRRAFLRRPEGFCDVAPPRHSGDPARPVAWLVAGGLSLPEPERLLRPVASGFVVKPPVAVPLGAALTPMVEVSHSALPLVRRGASVPTARVLVALGAARDQRHNSNDQSGKGADDDREGHLTGSRWGREGLPKFGLGVEAERKGFLAIIKPMAARGSIKDAHFAAILGIEPNDALAVARRSADGLPGHHRTPNTSARANGTATTLRTASA